MANPKNRTPNFKQPLPELLRFLGLNMLLGSAIGVAFVSVVLLTDIAGLKDLIAQSSEPLLPLFLVYAFNVFTFSGVTMGVAVMRLPYEEHTGDTMRAPKARPDTSAMRTDHDEDPVDRS
ncbi:MAG: hypothetical protein JSR99_04980 [Proteobacteria bacterium]|nr:hypothetical protein [Pseudomonadota bacterium]